MSVHGEGAMFDTAGLAPFTLQVGEAQLRCYARRDQGFWSVQAATFPEIRVTDSDRARAAKRLAARLAPEVARLMENRANHQGPKRFGGGRPRKLDPNIRPLLGRGRGGEPPEPPAPVRNYRDD